MLLTSAVPCASPSQPPDTPCCSSAVAATAGSAADVPAEVAELQAELELLRAKVESHPEVKRFAVENLHLSEVGGRAGGGVGVDASPCAWREQTACTPTCLPSIAPAVPLPISSSVSLFRLLQEVKKFEGIVKRSELAALHADVDGLRGEMLRLEEERGRAQVGGFAVAACLAWAVSVDSAFPGALHTAGSGALQCSAASVWLSSMCHPRLPPCCPAAPLPLQAEAAAANEQAAAVRLGAEAAAEAIRAKAAAEVQAKAVSIQPRNQTPAQIAHHHQAKTRLPRMIAISYNLPPLSLAVSKLPLPHCRRCCHRCRPWRRLSCGSSCLSSSGRRGRQRAPCAPLLGTRRSSLPGWRCWRPLLTSWRGGRLLLLNTLTHMPGCMRSRHADGSGCGRWQSRSRASALSWLARPPAVLPLSDAAASTPSCGRS